jgi:cell wall-associated NlpC family hydrolase
MSAEMFTTADIIDHARQCLGTPFRHQGRLISFGLDCVGVAIHVARQIGVGHLDVSGYGRTPANGQLERSLDAQPCLERVALADMLPGDLLLMRFASEPQHLAILASHPDNPEQPTIIHAYEAARKCCEHRLSDLWQARIVRVYRFRGDE